MQGTCDVSKSSDDEYLNETEVRDDLEVNDAESPNEALESAKSNLSWFERQLAYMNSDSKQFFDIPAAITAGVTDDDAYARQAQREEWAKYPKYLAIGDCESHIGTLQAEIACMKGKRRQEPRDDQQ